MFFVVCCLGRPGEQAANHVVGDADVGAGGRHSDSLLVDPERDCLHRKRWLERQQADQRIGIHRTAQRDGDLHVGLRR